MSAKITVVLLPGLNGTEALFRAFIECSPEEYEIMSISYPTHQKLSYSQLCCYVRERLNTLKTDYILVGESFSGPIALFLAQTMPPGLIGVVLVATFVLPPNLNIGRFLPWSFCFAVARPTFTFFGSMKKRKGLISSIFDEIQKVSSEVLADRIASIFSVNAVKALVDCEVPLIYFRGTKDLMVPKRNLDVMTGLKPSMLVAYFDTNHFLLQTQPHQAWHEIGGFIDSQIARQQH